MDSINGRLGVGFGVATWALQRTALLEASAWIRIKELHAGQQLSADGTFHVDADFATSISRCSTVPVKPAAITTSSIGYVRRHGGNDKQVIHVPPLLFMMNRHHVYIQL